MAKFKAFQAVRPEKKYVSEIAALPYDVYNREEAKQIVTNNPLSFLAIDRAETSFSNDVSTYDDRVYEKANALLQEQIAKGYFVEDSSASYYIYRLTMNGRSQAGLVGCTSVEDYENGIVKKHENTRNEKELDRIRHVDVCNAQTGPIFLAYRAKEEITDFVTSYMNKSDPLYQFVSEDGIEHALWKIEKEEDISFIEAQLAKVDHFYIADGHHRCASAAKVGKKRREENPNHTGEEAYNYILSVLFPDKELFIMDYNRVVRDLNGWTEESFLEELKHLFKIESIGKVARMPKRKAEVMMYLGSQWYQITLRQKALDCPVKQLDVAMLQEQILEPILGITDPKTDQRIDFVGGIRGLEELERRVKEDMSVAFALYPTQMSELFQVADAGLLMPPKSTWFEPKLRSGLFIHKV